ncbi:diguanylate cyclase/phosphodiesterasewith PAS/PAC sensor [Pseudanabaena sp. lw0831]|uniref:putative bifunctional diguanylate cyclase/phosphodiesterase n=1 Tax=Pseudanabaena sp. lw0831 TaxID=1357935 RepID=UPI00191631AE|nr:bifunctional diguanylate cyclase/phosphodiesterase [Pseudanabaena sp. lw0831]GBO52253.1 diguanylate cyclase/phosphodiesterasewith PAS/PAC sensor [Pseudanabaena sp. lw0831]
MKKLFSETLLALFDCANRISESEALTKQQQDDLQSIKSFGETLAICFDNAEREINILKQRIKRLDRSNPSLEFDNENETYTLIALIFARLRQSINIDELLGNVALEVHQLLQSDQVIVYQLADQDIQTIQYEVVNDSRYSLLGQAAPSIYTDLQWLEKFQTSISQVINDVADADSDPLISSSLMPLGIHSAIAIAIPSGKKLWGLLILHQYNIPCDWRNWEIELLEKIGIQLAISIHQMKLLVKSDDIRIERDQIIARLLYNQLHDSLTDLPNRDSFMESLDLAFTKLQTDNERNFAVLFIDCDRFKSINDSFGTAIGNQLLQEISKRIAIYRNNNITMARIDSDEFVLLVENIGTDNLERESCLTQLAGQILESIGEPFLINDYQILTSVSIGIAISDLEYVCANEILRDANLAMHHSRSLGRGKQALFTTSMNQGAKVRWQLESDLRQAIARQEFYLVYQPIVSLHQHDLSGFEVLLRWMHPLQGLISPMEFLAIAEETGEIVQIGYWVLETACRQLHQWQQEFPNIPPITIAINVSTIQVIQPEFVERIQSIISEYQILPSLIKLEITETMLMDNIEISSQKLEQLRGIGVQVYIDDFGTGYSSFSYLQTLPIDVLKIDRSFTNRVSTDIKSQRIVQSILRLANNLGMGIVIEGVETSQELDYFETLGGSSIEVQGYFISHPLDSEKATQWIQSTTYSLPI